jgi:hypothetical protein
LSAISIRQTVARGPIACLCRVAADFVVHRYHVIEQQVFAETRGRGHLIQKGSGNIRGGGVGYESDFQ